MFREYPKSVHAVGFKLLYNQPTSNQEQNQQILNYLKSVKDLKVIHLKRKNYLASYVSLISARSSGSWMSTKNVKSEKYDRLIEIDYEDCIKEFEKIQNWEKEYDELFVDHPVYQVNYEELKENLVESLKHIQNFLGVPQKTLYSNTIKQSKIPLDQKITNYKELKDKFSGSDWSSFFE